MRKALIYAMMMFLSATAFSQGKLVQMGPSFIQPLQERDSVLIADQLFYGFELSQVEEGTQFAFPEIKDTLMTNMRIVKPWQMDTVKASRQKKGQPRFFDLKGGLTITTFEEGIYYLPRNFELRISFFVLSPLLKALSCNNQHINQVLRGNILLLLRRFIANVSIQKRRH